MQTTADFPMSLEKEKLSETAALKIIRSADQAAIATVDQAGVPYCVSITPAYIDGAIYFHGTAGKSRKSENLESNPRCSLLFVAASKILPEAYDVEYGSAIVDGLAEEVREPEEMKAVLEKFLALHAPENAPEKNEAYIQKWFSHVRIWKIKILKVSGKARTPALWE